MSARRPAPLTRLSTALLQPHTIARSYRWAREEAALAVTSRPEAVDTAAESPSLAAEGATSAPEGTGRECARPSQAANAAEPVPSL